ncbi:protein kinase [Sphaerisporangium sp. TRM90804]|uniref:serine/threonine protein kinase n=1 Tax=Sphaerisporangium sp. TRM90804 TaxID=3031113 RepID=UPI00244C64FA|nr:protein kinase [Sphaerisporangium sp. TRM90804]MDH2428228.1 protein kinase [Sphaerisporangium sp. TRM90804]
MPEVLPLRSDDPSELGTYHIVGRIGEGGRSIVYLGKGPGSEHVAIKILHADLSGSDRFLDKVEELRQVSAFCTAQVIETGLAGDRPYVVSEYIDGPTLERAVQEDGPLRGPALHRLAIGTMTALVAIHQAGIVHREFSPGNVLLGPDGPRVIDFGIAQALDAGVESTTRSVGTPAYLTPEQLEGAAVGPAADMFAWGSTVLYAASGRAPFEAGSMSATINRVLRDEPDLSVLNDDLLSLVAQCLAKDPARRPTASDALLRLVGHSQILATMEPAQEGAGPPAAPAPGFAVATPPQDVRMAPPPDPGTRVELPPPPGRGRARRRLLPLVAAAVAIALVSGGTVYALTSRTDRPPAQPQAAPTPLPAPSAALIQASPTPPPKASEKFTAPGTKLTVHENPADPVRLASYFIQDIDGKKLETYARYPGADEFKKIADGAGFGDATVSPDGKWAAVNPFIKFSASSTDYVTFVNLATGEKFNVDTLKQPLRGLSGTWSRDSKRLLLTVYEIDKDSETQYPEGFVVVDVTTRKATVVLTDDKRDGYGNFDWTPDGAYVVGAYEKDKPRFGIRFRDMSGKVVRTIPWVGMMSGPGLYSPSGESFFTYCPEDSGKRSNICVWNARSGNRTATIKLWEGSATAYDWWDEHHIIVFDPRKDPRKYVVLDFHGKAVRTLAEHPKGDETTHQLRYLGS